MKKFLLSFIIIVLLLNGIFAWFVYQKKQHAPTPTEPVVTISEPSLAEKILVSSMDMSQLDTETKTQIEASIKQQVNDTDRLLTLAKAENTVANQVDLDQSYQRALYEHGGEAGLAEYLATIGISDETFRTHLEDQVILKTFLTAKAAPTISDEAVRAYYDSLTEDERDEFESMKYDIYDSLMSEAIVRLRTELLSN